MFHDIYTIDSRNDRFRLSVRTLTSWKFRYSMPGMQSKFRSAVFFSAILSVAAQAYPAEPDTLKIFCPPGDGSTGIPSQWKHVLPKKNRASTNYSIERLNGEPYLRAVSSATDSWLELDVGDIDVSEYRIMEWMWMVNQFPETEWEMSKENDDFAIRIELLYDYKGGKKNILNIVRKGLLKSVFMGYPPELIVDYVWSLNVPPEKAYWSPSAKNTMVVPIESDVAMQGRWVRERRNIRDDLVSFNGEKTTLVLKRIRIRSDTESVPSIAESGLKYIYLIPETAGSE